jgi:hypothetical protein
MRRVLERVEADAADKLETRRAYCHLLLELRKLLLQAFRLERERLAAAP